MPRPSINSPTLQIKIENTMWKAAKGNTWGKGGGNGPAWDPTTAYCAAVRRPAWEVVSPSSYAGGNPGGREKPISSHKAMSMAKVGNLARRCPWRDASAPALSRVGWAGSHGEGQCEWALRLMALTQASATASCSALPSPLTPGKGLSQSRSPAKPLELLRRG